MGILFSSKIHISQFEVNVNEIRDSNPLELRAASGRRSGERAATPPIHLIPNI